MISGQDSVLLQRDLRLRILSMYYAAKAGHIGCSLSCIDLMIACLIRSRDADDKFLLSKGHAAAALYACIHYLGGISDEDLGTFYRNGTALSAHPAPCKFTDIPFATGSLGHGLPIGCGIARGKKMAKQDGCVFVLMSDGETNEGTTWEATHFAVHHKLDNLIVMVDRNGLQGFGTTKEIFGETASAGRFREIGFETIETDGHNVDTLSTVLMNMRKNRNGKPKMILADTVKGKGVSYMEDRMEWHYLAMNEEKYRQAVEEVNVKYAV